MKAKRAVWAEQKYEEKAKDWQPPQPKDWQQQPEGWQGRQSKDWQQRQPKDWQEEPKSKDWQQRQPKDWQERQPKDWQQRQTPWRDGGGGGGRGSEGGSGKAGSKRTSTTRVYVQNLPLDVPQNDIEQFFWEFGKVLGSQMVAIGKSQKEGTRCAIIRFEDEAAASAAISAVDGQRGIRKADWPLKATFAKANPKWE